MESQDATAQKTVEFRCECGLKIRARIDQSGRTYRCSSCGRGLRVPAISFVSEEPTAPVSSAPESSSSTRVPQASKLKAVGVALAVAVLLLVAGIIAAFVQSMGPRLDVTADPHNLLELKNGGGRRLCFYGIGLGDTVSDAVEMLKSGKLLAAGSPTTQPIENEAYSPEKGFGSYALHMADSGDLTLYYRQDGKISEITYNSLRLRDFKCNSYQDVVRLFGAPKEVKGWGSLNMPVPTGTTYIYDRYNLWVGDGGPPVGGLEWVDLW